MVAIAQSGFIWANMDVIGQSGCIRQSGCIWEKVVVNGANWFYFGKSVCIPEK